MDVLKIINEEIQNVLNDNFWKWFGDSVVVDADGKPLKVYHGTREDFNEFKGDLMYFSTTPEYASQFSSAPDLVKGGSNPAVLPVYLKITNPLDLRELETYVMTDEEFLSVLFNYGVDVGDKDIQFQRGYNLPAWSWLRENYHRLVPAIKESYDGVIMYESNNARGGKNLSDLIYVVFQPNQIKSATGNNGEYSSNPDITKENLYEDIIREVRLFTQSFYDEQRQYDEGIADRILVYHGTNSSFNDFDTEFQNSVTGFGDFGRGFYFSQKMDIAKYYTLKSKENRTVIKAWVTIKKPFVIDINNEVFSSETKERYNKLRGLQDYERQAIKEYINDDIDFAYRKITKELGDERFSDILRVNGYDGVIVNRTLGGETTRGAEIIVYNQSQIDNVNSERLMVN